MPKAALLRFGDFGAQIITTLLLKKKIAMIYSSHVD